MMKHMSNDNYCNKNTEFSYPITAKAGKMDAGPLRHPLASVRAWTYIGAIKWDKIIPNTVELSGPLIWIPVM